ncbi:hypothetical protein GF342_04965, partial [Candidatus Woesearchaeota archaeon]|nr:hypothetical protein [Candidatus Woesearchaeota archaeon]
MSEEYLRSSLAARFAPYQLSDRILVTSVRGITRVEYGLPVHSLDVTR